MPVTLGSKICSRAPSKSKSWHTVLGKQRQFVIQKREKRNENDIQARLKVF